MFGISIPELLRMSTIKSECYRNKFTAILSYLHFFYSKTQFKIQKHRVWVPLYPRSHMLWWAWNLYEGKERRRKRCNRSENCILLCVYSTGYVWAYVFGVVSLAFALPTKLPVIKTIVQKIRHAGTILWMYQIIVPFSIRQQEVCILMECSG